MYNICQPHSLKTQTSNLDVSYTDPSYTDLFYTSQPPSQTLKTFASWSAKQLPALTLRACVDAAVVEAIGVSVCEGWGCGGVHRYWVVGCGCGSLVVGSGGDHRW